jgi:2,6-dihydroxypyridine 3-monooxygenase
MRMPRTAVVGGSIAGLTAACLLRDIGCEVDVYERARGTLSGYGAGIVVQPELVRYFLERTDITLERISVTSHRIRYFNAATGAFIGERITDSRYTSYNALYESLLASFGREHYHLDRNLVGLDQSTGGVSLRFADGTVTQCDLAVCADGSFSTARHLLLGIVPAYAGYLTWRGLAGRDVLSGQSWDFFQGSFTYGLLDNGHVIAYPIPTLGDDLTVNGQNVNFQWYWNVAEGADLDDMMTDREGVRRPVSVHASGVRKVWLDELHRRAHDELGLGPLTEIMLAVEAPYLTIIADTDVPRMAVGQVCLIGDAAITGRPHAAASAAKAAVNAWTLAEALLDTAGDVEEALRRWEPGQLRQGRAFLAKVRRMGTLLQHGGTFLPDDPSCRWGMPSTDC